MYVPFEEEVSCPRCKSPNVRNIQYMVIVGAGTVEKESEKLLCMNCLNRFDPEPAQAPISDADVIEAHKFLTNKEITLAEVLKDGPGEAPK